MDRSEVIDRLRSRWAGMSGKLGMLVIVVGFAVIFWSWNGAAEKDYTQGQVPYLISGGVGGLGLIILGSSLLVIESNRRDRIELERRLEELTNAVSHIGATGAPGAAGNGHSEPDTRVTVPADPGMVVAGPSSFHRPDCHLLGDRATAELVPRERAEADELTPCRVCTP